MDFLNEKVIHKTFGEGSIINFDDTYVKISFKSGDKKFRFPDAFKDYITFIDKKATNVVSKKIEERDEELKIEQLVLQKEADLEREKLSILNQIERTKNSKIHPSRQSVFWCEPNEELQIFTDWKVFSGEIKSGNKKGEPRRFVRMNQSSASLITGIKDGMPEEDRRILGMFMPNETFDGRLCADGYIEAHPEYRIHLSEAESKKMLFWNYYVDEKSPTKTIWNSGRQRYFENVWMAQILRDIVDLRKKPEEQKHAKAFFEYFCKVNFIDQRQLPNANGALKRI